MTTYFFLRSRAWPSDDVLFFLRSGAWPSDDFFFLRSRAWPSDDLLFFEIGQAGRSDDLLFFWGGRGGAQSQPRSRKPQEWTQMAVLYWFYKGFASISGPPTRPMATYFFMSDDLFFWPPGLVPGPRVTTYFFLRSRPCPSDDLLFF